MTRLSDVSIVQCRVGSNNCIICKRNCAHKGGRGDADFLFVSPLAMMMNILSGVGRLQKKLNTA